MNSTSASSKEGRFRFDIEKYTHAPTQSYRPFRRSLLSFCATFAHRDEPVKAGVWIEHLDENGCFLTGPTQWTDDTYLQRFESHLHGDGLHPRYAALRDEFDLTRPERISAWHNRQLLLFNHMRGFFSGSGLAALDSAYENVIELRVTAARQDLADTLGPADLAEVAREPNLPDPRALLQCADTKFGRRQAPHPGAQERDRQGHH